jgi:galactose mutarotase-like enzyme
LRNFISTYTRNPPYFRPVISLQNPHITASISEFGAELQLLNHAVHGNIIWRKDDHHWNRFAPILFPIVGRLLQDQYRYGNETYALKQHGFARDEMFEVIEQTETIAVLKLSDNERTRLQFPFAFELFVTYELLEHAINIHYEVRNTGNSPLHYSIGGHPGFHLDGDLSDYYLDFGGEYVLPQHLIEGNYYSGKTQDIKLSRNFKLEDSLFQSDAIVLKNPTFQSLGFGKQGIGTIFTFHCKDCTALGLWTKPGAPFFCIEPWWGWADAISTTGNLEEKDGIQVLASGAENTFGYTIAFQG